MSALELNHWLFVASLAVGGLAFVGCFVTLVIQPLRTFRWFGVCFALILVCVGNVFLLGSWQAALKQSAAIRGDLRIGAGIAAWLFGLIFAAGGWFGDKPKPEDESPDGQRRVCTGHARSINVLAFVGGLALAAAMFYIVSHHIGEAHQQLLFVGLFLAGQIPAALRALVFLPRCVVCGGPMKAVRWRPVHYRCRGCGGVQETNINLVNRKSR